MLHSVPKACNDVIGCEVCDPGKQQPDCVDGVYRYKITILCFNHVKGLHCLIFLTCEVQILKKGSFFNVDLNHNSSCLILAQITQFN